MYRDVGDMGAFFDNFTRYYTSIKVAPNPDCTAIRQNRGEDTWILKHGADFLSVCGNFKGDSEIRGK